MQMMLMLGEIYKPRLQSVVVFAGVALVVVTVAQTCVFLGNCNDATFSLDLASLLPGNSPLPGVAGMSSQLFSPTFSHLALFLWPILSRQADALVGPVVQRMRKSGSTLS